MLADTITIGGKSICSGDRHYYFKSYGQADCRISISPTAQMRDR